MTIWLSIKFANASFAFDTLSRHIPRLQLNIHLLNGQPGCGVHRHRPIRWYWVSTGLVLAYRTYFCGGGCWWFAIQGLNWSMGVIRGRMVMKCVSYCNCNKFHVKNNIKNNWIEFSLGIIFATPTTTEWLPQQRVDRLFKCCVYDWAFFALPLPRPEIRKTI